MSTSLPPDVRRAAPARVPANEGHGAAAVQAEAEPGAIDPSTSGTAQTFKRVADVALAASGLAVTAPLVAVLAALVLLDSPGPALFFQQRTGLHQRPFTLVKLRTMDSA